MSTRKTTISIVILSMILAAGLYLSPSRQNPIKKPSSGISQQALFSFLQENNASPDVTEAYMFAFENPREVLSQVKCYCGCLSQGHLNNQDCFIKDDGSPDLMGLNCGLCVKTALTAKQMLAQGKTIAEISRYVDTKWGQ